jgi:hypothetical protein
MLTGGLWQLLRERAAMPEGVSTAEVAELTGLAVVNVGVACTTLRNKGEIVSLRLSHKKSRYFTTQEAADAYLKRHRPRIDNLAKAKITEPKVRWANAEAITPPGVEVQRVPGYPGPRNEMHEFPFLHTRKGL